MFQKLKLTATLLLFILSTIAQEVEYENFKLSFQQKPSYPQYANYSTFDMAAVTTLDETQVNMNLPYQIKFGNFQQVQVSNDFHVLSILKRLVVKINSETTLTANINLAVMLYDRYGNKIKGVYVDREDLVISLSKPMSKDERGSRDFVRQKVVERVTESLLEEFVNEFSGAKVELPFELATLSGVKKNPDLIDFDKTIKGVKTPTDSLTLLKQLEPHVAYWLKASNYNNTAYDTVEVKRAAYQNLIIYYIVKGDLEIAKELIEKYKGIDKVHKMLMGLVKVKHSENCEKLIAQMYPPQPQPIDESAPVVALRDLKDNYKYVNLNGTITIEGKRDGGTYVGQVQISKIENTGQGGIVALNAEAASVKIFVKNEKGENRIINTDLANVTAFKDDNGKMYMIRKFGSAALGGSYYSILQPSYQSAKITVYRAIIPAGSNDYVIVKAGDTEGIKTSIFNSWKQLTEYLSDCKLLIEKINNGQISKSEKIEKVAELYSNCN